MPGGLVIAVGRWGPRNRLYAESPRPSALADPKPVPGRPRHCSACGGRHPGLDALCGYCVAFYAGLMSELGRHPTASAGPPCPEHEARIERYRDSLAATGRIAWEPVDPSVTADLFSGVAGA